MMKIWWCFFFFFLNIRTWFSYVTGIADYCYLYLLCMHIHFLHPFFPGPYPCPFLWAKRRNIIAVSFLYIGEDRRPILSICDHLIALRSCPDATFKLRVPDSSEGNIPTDQPMSRCSSHVILYVGTDPLKANTSDLLGGCACLFLLHVCQASLVLSALPNADSQLQICIPPAVT